MVYKYLRQWSDFIIYLYIHGTGRFFVLKTKRVQLSKSSCLHVWILSGKHELTGVILSFRYFIPNFNSVHFWFKHTITFQQCLMCIVCQLYDICLIFSHDFDNTFTSSVTADPYERFTPTIESLVFPKYRELEEVTFMPRMKCMSLLHSDVPS